MLKRLVEKSFEKSSWIYHVNLGSCKGCETGFKSVIEEEFDAVGFGFKLCRYPRHADMILVTGPVNEHNRGRLLKVLEGIPEPKVVVLLGSCPFPGRDEEGEWVSKPLKDMDISVGGCPVEPQAIVDGVLRAVGILKQKFRSRA